MKSTKVVFVSLLASIPLLLACARSGEEAASPPEIGPLDPPPVVIPPPPPPPEVQVVIPEISPEAVLDPEGCMNLGALYAELRRLPMAAHVRQVTTSFEIAGEPKAPPERLVRQLSHASLRFREMTVKQYVAHLPRAEQSGCKRLKLDASERGRGEFAITASGPRELSIESAHRQETIRWSGPRELTLSTRTLVLDRCSEEGASYEAETTSVVRWDRAEVLNEKPELFARSYLKTIQGTLLSPLEEVARLLTASPETELVSLNSNELQRMTEGEIHVEVRRCRPPKTGPGPTPQPMYSADVLSREQIQKLVATEC